MKSYCCLLLGLSLAPCQNVMAAPGITAPFPSPMNTASFTTTQTIPEPNAVYYALILDRYREVLLQHRAPNPNTVRKWMDALDADGKWPDIDYSDETRGLWKVREHLVRLEALCLALTQPSSPLFNDPDLEKAVMRAFAHWTTRRYQNPNWWHNDIGVPQLMRDSVVLLGSRLQGELRQSALEVVNQFGRPRGGDSANTVWEAELQLSYGALTGNDALIEGASQLISAEIHVSDHEGIQSDFSFHAHGPRLQQHHYGGAYLSDAARLGWQLRGTPWAFAPQKRNLLADTILQGSQWMTRGGYISPHTLDRAVSRPNALKNGDLREIARELREILPERAPEFDALIARQDKNEPLTGFRVFPRSDFLAYHRPAFSFFLKTVSSRDLLSESINGENLQGRRLGMGDHYLLRQGPEYFDLMPVWDWNLLPGVTGATDAGQPKLHPFAGAVGDDSGGVAAMDTEFDGDKGTSLKARKFWACHGDVVVSLIGDLTAQGVASPVRTALDQCALNGAVTVGTASGEVKTLSEGVADPAPLRWIQHAGFAYLPLGGVPVSVRLGPQTGTWRSINQGGSPAPVTKAVFLPVLEHGTAPQSQNSGFVIAASATPQDAAALVARPTWTILRNDASCQAVAFEDGTAAAAFYAPARLEREGKTLLEVSGPCLVQMKPHQVIVCDPTQKGETLTLRVAEGQALSVVLPPNGKGVAVAFQTN